MSLPSDRGRRTNSGVLLSALLGAALLASCPASAETITAREMLRGTEVTADSLRPHPQCRLGDGLRARLLHALLSLDRRRR